MKIPFRCEYTCGPYQGYFGSARYYADDGVFHGEVVGTMDVITFQGKSFAELPRAFQDSVDDYLDFCKQLNQKPNKPYSGKFVVRTSPDLHHRIAVAAKSSGKSLNQFVNECLGSAAGCDAGVDS